MSSDLKAIRQIAQELASMDRSLSNGDRPDEDKIKIAAMAGRGTALAQLVLKYEEPIQGVEVVEARGPARDYITISVPATPDNLSRSQQIASSLENAHWNQVKDGEQPDIAVMLIADPRGLGRRLEILLGIDLQGDVKVANAELEAWDRLRRLNIEPRVTVNA